MDVAIKITDETLERVNKLAHEEIQPAKMVRWFIFTPGDYETNDLVLSDSDFRRSFEFVNEERPEGLSVVREKK